MAQWEFKARYHLTASDSQTMTIAELLAMGDDADRQNFEQLGLGYIDTWGTDSFRDAVASTYDICTSNDVLTFAGAEEAMFWVFQELLGPEDHAVITAPNYQSMESVPLATGASVTGVALDPNDAWRLDLDAVRAAFRPNTRVVAVNFPNNPTGALPPVDTFTQLVKLCDEHNTWLFSDEVYRGVERDPARTLPQAADLSPRAISLNVMSKAYGMPGLRVGWLTCRDHALLSQLERRKHYTSICNAAPSEMLATIALRNAEAVRARNRSIVETNLEIFDGFFERYGDSFDWYHPDGGSVVFPRYNGADGADEFCRRAIEEEGVLLLPGSIYRSDVASVPTDRFRIGLGRLHAEPALDALGRVVKSSPSGTFVFDFPDVV